MASAAAGGLPGKGHDISLAALRRHDPYISRIVDVASQVALYTFGHRANEWVRADAAAMRKAGRGQGGRCWARGRGPVLVEGDLRDPPAGGGRGIPKVWLAAESQAQAWRTEDRSSRAAEGKPEAPSLDELRSRSQKCRAGTHLRASLEE